MIATLENEYFSTRNFNLNMAAMSVIGDRVRQEDCFGYRIDENNLILCMCDGMGGYEGGNLASRRAVETVLNSFDDFNEGAEPIAFLNRVTMCANDEVCALHSISEELSGAGCTMVVVLICHNEMYWSSVGDSRVYIKRRNEFIRVTKDQNYRTVLSEKRYIGQITNEEYSRADTMGDVLVNFLGIGKLGLVDYNKEPLLLEQGDMILVCTDGLYRIIGDDVLDEMLVQDDVAIVVNSLEQRTNCIAYEKNITRDNISAALMIIK